jgi:hypothetical protein
VRRGVTYNFDPDRWFDIEKTALEARRRKGELDDDAFDAALCALADRYEEMLARLDIRYDYGNN